MALLAQSDNRMLLAFWDFAGKSADRLLESCLQTIPVFSIEEGRKEVRVLEQSPTLAGLCSRILDQSLGLFDLVVRFELSLDEIGRIRQESEKGCAWAEHLRRISRGGNG